MKRYQPTQPTGRSLLLTVLLACLAITASATDTKYVNSQADWENIVKNYDGKEVNVILNTDVTFDKQGIQMDKFVGTLDGRGHAFVFNYKDNKNTDANYYDSNWSKDSAPFEDAKGTIKNLRLTGTIAIRYGYAAYRESNPLVRDLESEITIENCLSEINFVNTGDQAAGWNTCHIGGFIGQMTSSKGKAIFKNCAFTGSFVYTEAGGGHDYNDTGGFVGYQNGGEIEIYNCFSNLSYDERGTVKTFSYFVGNPKTSDLTIYNAYGYCVDRSGTAVSLKNEEGCTDLYASSKTDFMGNGVLTMFLNSGMGGVGTCWAQTIGTDATPQLKTFSTASQPLPNLVTNGTFANNVTNWTASGADSEIQTSGSNKYWRTGQSEAYLSQTVDLTQHYTEEQLATNLYDVILACDVSLQYGCTVAYVRYIFYDARGEKIDEKYLTNSSYIDREYSTLNWESFGDKISLPSGTRSVKVTLCGRDYNRWAGYFGPAFDNVCLALFKTGLAPSISVSLPNEYNTFCNSIAALDFTGNADVEAYTAKMNDAGTYVTLTKVDQVPAGAGVVLKKIGTGATATVNTAASAASLTDNQMVGVTSANTVSAATLVAANGYILTGQEFHKVLSGATGYMPAGKAYLKAPASASAKSVPLGFGTPTGVTAVETSDDGAPTVYYNIQGMRVDKPTSPGLYIVNGKKVIF